MNIFMTVGTQLPFDRLVAAVDGWASRNRSQVVGQIGRSLLRPQHIKWQSFFEAGEAHHRLRTADLVISHAGMGTILTRLETGKPLVIMPRLARLGEHRNDHQLATASRMSHLPAVRVAGSESELRDFLDRFSPGATESGIGNAASDGLLGAIRHFIAA